MFKKLERPSIYYVHGLPAIYTEFDNATDYLMVWGERMKQNYINIGFEPDKIKVIGCHKYINTEVSNDGLRNSLENVLVLPCASNLMIQCQWDTPRLIDRSMVVLYLYQVQNVLMKFGVKHARFRPHPSMDKEWVYGFLDQNFYKMDKEPLLASLNQSSLVIGATSTTFLEALMAGVNFLFYEPVDEHGAGLCSVPLVPPFDGSVKNFSIARTEDDLEYMIRDKYLSDPKVIDGYIQPLDLSVLKEIIK